MLVRVEFEETVEGIVPEVALAWWTDYQEGEVDHSFVRGAQRSVRGETDAVMIEDRVEWLGLPVFTERVRAQPRGNKVELLGENTWATFRARYVFEHIFEPEGTLVRVSADIDGRGPLGWMDSLTRPIAVKILRWDTRKHLEEMQADLQADLPPELASE